MHKLAALGGAFAMHDCRSLDCRSLPCSRQQGVVLSQLILGSLHSVHAFLYQIVRVSAMTIFVQSLEEEAFWSSHDT
jgi:hypothetical protein